MIHNSSEQFNKLVDALRILFITGNELTPDALKENGIDINNLSSSYLTDALRRIYFASDSAALQQIIIKGFTFETPFLLTNIRSHNSPYLPPLILKKCSFYSGIDLSRSDLSLLSIHNCYAPFLKAQNTYFRNGIVIENFNSSESHEHATGMIAPDDWYKRLSSKTHSFKTKNAPRSQPVCYIDMKNARVDGDIEISLSTFTALRSRDNRERGSEPNYYALSFVQAQITGSFILNKNSVALGGCSLSGATINGNLYLATSKLIGGEGYALNCQLTTIKGFAGLRADYGTEGYMVPFESVGKLFLLQTSIGSSLDLSGAYMVAGKDSDIVLYLYHTTIGDRLLCQESEDAKISLVAYGRIMIIDSDILGDMYINKCNINRPTLSPYYMGELTDNTQRINEPVLSLYQSFFGNNVTLSGVYEGSLSLRGVKISSNLYLGLEIIPAVNQGVPKLQQKPLLDLSYAKISNILYVEDIKISVEDPLQKINDALSEESILQGRSASLSWCKELTLYEYLIQVHNNLYVVAILKSPQFSRILQGGGDAIQEIIKKAKNLHFASEKDVLDYLRFFVSYVWGPEGGFYLLEPSSPLAAYFQETDSWAVVPVKITKDDHEYRIEANVLYGRGIFKANFKIDQKNDGINIEMINDEPLLFGVERHIVYEKRLRKSKISTSNNNIWFDDPPIPAKWNDERISGNDYKILSSAVSNEPEEFKIRPLIRMHKCETGQLNDDDGENWPGETRIDLTGFEYQSVSITDQKDKLNLYRSHHLIHDSRSKLRRILKNEPLSKKIEVIIGIVFAIIILPIVLMIVIIKNRLKKPEPAWKKRIKWLRMQFDQRRPTKEEFHPQPYQNIARVYRNQGQLEEAKKFLIQRNKDQLVILPWSSKIIHWLYGLLFGYGMSLLRALCTTAIIITLGASAIDWAKQHKLFRGKHCQENPHSLLYAMDTFVPLITFHSEKVCSVVNYNSIKLPDHGNWLDLLWRWALPNRSTWEAAVIVYSIAGWIITSILILTATGVLQRMNREL